MYSALVQCILGEVLAQRPWITKLMDTENGLMDGKLQFSASAFKVNKLSFRCDRTQLSDKDMNQVLLYYYREVTAVVVVFQTYSND